MKAIVVDSETRVHRFGDGKYEVDGSPFHPSNGIVCVNWRFVDMDTLDIGDSTNSIFNHNDYVRSDSPEVLQDALDSADIIVAHHAKFDVTYLL